MGNNAETPNRLLGYYLENILEVGCDEAGRGCLAGPVFAAAVILPNDFFNPVLNDSKKMTEKQRYELQTIIENEAVAYAVAQVDNETIDKINILRASILAMHKAIEKLTQVPEHIIVDGNHFNKFRDIPHKCIIKGDSKYASIAAASVLAKTYRDDYMHKIHNEFPMYHWNKNKAYPTVKHRSAIAEHGITKYHRRSFRLLSQQMTIPFDK